jgi:hypothetical protein
MSAGTRVGSVLLDANSRERDVAHCATGHGCGNSRAARTTARSVAANIDVSPIGIGELVSGLRPIIKHSGLRLGMRLVIKPRFRLHLSGRETVA